MPTCYRLRLGARIVNMPHFREHERRQEIAGREEVTVTEISLDSVKPPPIPSMYSDEAAQRMRGVTPKAYRLSWKGDPTPRDAVVGGHTIMQLREGVVSDETGEKIGTYERFRKLDGSNEANVFLYADPK